MWLERIRLQNIRSYREAELDLSKGINIIIGDNNSGKSTIIRSIDRLQGHNWNSEGLVRNGEKYGLGEFVFRQDDGSLKTKSKKKKPLASKETSFKVVLIADKPRLFFGKTSSAIDSRLRADKLQLLLKHNQEGGVSISGYGPFEPFPDEEPNNVFYASYSRRGWFDSQISEESTHKIRQDLGNLTSRLHKLENGNHPNHKEFKNACKDLLGFEPGPIAIGRGGTANQFTVGIYTDNTNIIVLNHMGQGVAQVLGLLTILLTQQNKIILLEEIENDLHPKVLKKLLELIAEKSKENQFIISTHSNIVLKHLGSLQNSKIFRTSWKMASSNNQNLPISNIVEVAAAPESRIKILKEMGYEITDFELWEGYLFFEESTSEMFFKEFLIPQFVPKLVNKIGTFSSKGIDSVVAKLKAFLGLFVFIHLSAVYKKKAWAIVDGDEPGRKVIEELKITYNNWPPDHFVALGQPDFELYYPERFKDQVKQVLSMPKGPHKQAAKVSLREQVLAWALADKKNAKKEFRKSAFELIQLLTKIEKHLTKD